ncbi:Adenine/guanine permease AZG1 [Spatholobus suberectus]|nr:Adenine/guanine permease AZG1 [Spatholobus suberectus]
MFVLFSACTNSSIHVFQLDNSCNFDLITQSYVTCLENTRRDLIVATIASSLIGCFTNHHKHLVKLPLCLTLGIGSNSYFVNTVVSFHNFDNISYL